MNKSESIGSLAAALAKAQGAMQGAKKDSENPFFKSRYADLASTWEACRAALSSNGLAVIQTTEAEDENGCIPVETILAHESGEWISGVLKVRPVKDDPQGMGSALTYARRYALAAIVGVAPEDDDGNAASQPGSKPNQRSAAPQQQTTEQALRGELLKQAEILSRQAGYTDANIKKGLKKLEAMPTDKMQQAIEELNQKIKAKAKPKPTPEPTNETTKESAVKSTIASIYAEFSKNEWDEAAIDKYLGGKPLEGRSLDALVAIHDELTGGGPAF